MSRFCRATNGWRNKRLCDAWKAEHRHRKPKKKPKPRYRNAKYVTGKWIVVKHESGHVFKYNGPPDVATIRMQISGPCTRCPWPGFSNWSDLTLRGATKQ